MSDTNRMQTMLRSEDPEQQTTALYVLLHEGKKAKCLDELLMCTNSPDANVRLPAFMVLGKMNKKEIIPYLEKALKDQFLKIRMTAAISLAKYKNKKAIPILADMIKKDIRDHSLHKRAIEALGKYEDESLIGIFEQMLQHRRIVSRIKAAGALAKLRGEKAYKILKNAELKETDGTVRARIQNSLQNLEQS